MKTRMVSPTMSRKSLPELIKDLGKIDNISERFNRLKALVEHYVPFEKFKIDVVGDDGTGRFDVEFEIKNVHLGDEKFLENKILAFSEGFLKMCSVNTPKPKTEILKTKSKIVYSNCFFVSDLKENKSKRLFKVIVNGFNEEKRKEILAHLEEMKENFHHKFGDDVEFKIEV